MACWFQQPPAANPGGVSDQARRLLAHEAHGMKQRALPRHSRPSIHTKVRTCPGAIEIPPGHKGFLMRL
ncbi:predicted protein [Chaetomium globosum CBS 148.51]|uniref:Uncharacterized protein n=1 Tax=Chaetomium globosum (strain ATCC 6205 / CBS 148.51 / DSM 1962 / NBRC 6347 / NRRL 1970) TaxID=306901 RepID=Q2H0S8_CHAGB|nr:uncharacterized protein CHGG_04618 [Chaetomium globosum CBS 148.51]EAQ87999.1 predicted protein [Chaetomium globosum CBS 148.51]